MAEQEPKDFIRRGDHSPNYAGVVAFLGLRPLGSLLQYQLLSGTGAALLARAGVSTITGAAARTGITLIDRLGLPPSHLVLLAMSVGAALKQMYWLVGLSKENFGVGHAVGVTLFNTVVDTANTLFFLASVTSAVNGPALPGVAGLSAYQVIGASLCTVGLLIETVSEYQRKSFKDDPANKGKVMRSGLWSLARHINYGGYTVWRGAYGLAAWGVSGALVTTTLLAYNFASNSVPPLDAYCGKRYGEQWTNFKRDVRWVLLPGIY